MHGLSSRACLIRQWLGRGYKKHYGDAALEVAAGRNVSFTPTLANFALRLIAADRERFPPTSAARLLPEFCGARADVLLLAADPTENLDALYGWRTVIADGRRYDRAVIAGWIERYRRHFRSRLYDGLMSAVVALAVDGFGHDER